MNLFTMPTFNNKYLSPNSAKPICGISLNDTYVRPLIQAKVLDDYLIPGTPVKLTLVEDTTNSATVNAGLNLAPNVMFATANTDATVNAFVVSSPTDFADFGDEYAVPVTNQIVYVAKAGSGAELYLPCDETIRAIDSTSVIKWDATNGVLTTTDTGLDITSISVLSQVVFGVAPYYDADSKTFKVKEVNAVKVKI